MTDGKVNKCPVCGPGDITLYMRGIFDSDSTDVLECRKCGLQFLDPMMTDEEEVEYYDDYYEKQRSRHFKEMALTDIRERAFRFYERYKDVYLPLIDGKPDVLEIGSGSGGFLQFLRLHNKGARVTAIERCGSNREFLSKDFGGFRILEDLSALRSAGDFDLVAAFGVFEHIKNNEEFLLNMKGLMKDGGLLVMNVPNKRNPLIDFFKVEEFRKFSYMKQHYYTYTEESLGVLAGRTGFRIEGFNYMQAWGLDNHLSWLINRRPHDFARFTGLLSETTLRSYENDLIRKKMTDLMMIVMAKK